jgi:hypothetical protein
MSGRYDDMLFMIAQDLGSIDRILFEFFGFLKRRTDFFVLANPGDSAGFPPGASEQMLFKTYQHFRDQQSREHPFTPRPREEKPLVLPCEAPAPVVLPEPEPAVERPKADPSISTYNGAATAKYKWSQDLSDVTLQLALPPGTKARDIQVTFETRKLKVVAQGQVLLQGPLSETVHRENSYWNIDDGTLVINLEKSKDCVWKSVMEGDQEIDPKTVDTSRRVDEYDEETQVGIRKVMYEHERKLKGLPTSEEEKAQNALMEMWNKSEFKGQPFDMSKIPLICKPGGEEKTEEEGDS